MTILDYATIVFATIAVAAGGMAVWGWLAPAPTSADGLIAHFRETIQNLETHAASEFEKATHYEEIAAEAKSEYEKAKAYAAKIGGIFS